MNATASERTALDRLLSAFTDVRGGEGRTALILLCSVFLILFSYYMIKPAREGWLAVSVVAGLSKIEIKAYSSFAQAIVLIGAVAGYSRLAALFSRRRLITIVSVFFAATLPVFWVLQPGLLADTIPYSGVAFYLWVGVFNVFIVAMFWSFAADFYSDERGRRLLPLIAIGATAGAALGSWVTGEVVSRRWVGTYDLLLVAVLPLLMSLLLARRGDYRGETPASETAEPVPAALGDNDSPWRLVARHRYLLVSAVLTVVLGWVATNGDNILFGIVQEVVEASVVENAVPEDAVSAYVREQTTAFYGDFYFWVNLAALIAQAFLASRLLRYGGFGVLILFLPVLSVVAYSTMAIFPVLAVIKVLKIAENSSNYSINNTARHVLWLPTTPEMKYKAKAAVDTLCVRLGDGLAALTVLVGVHLLGASPLQLLWVNVALGILWILLGVTLAREHAVVSRLGFEDEARAS